MPQKSAQEVVDKVREALANSPVLALRRLLVQQSAGKLLLTGQVTTFYQKQLAQEVARSVARGCEGNTHILNQVTVVPHHDAPEAIPDESGMYDRPPH